MSNFTDITVGAHQDDDVCDESVTQLTLLPTAPIPASFRLSEATRRLGKQHIAEIRAQLNEIRAVREASNVTAFPTRRRAA